LSIKKTGAFMKFELDEKLGEVVIEPGPDATKRWSQRSVAAPETAQWLNLKHILVPVDFSDCSKKAVQYAVHFAKQFGAELTLLHVAPLYPIVPEIGPFNVEDFQDGRTNLEIVRLTIGDFVPCHTLLRMGTPASEIAGVARELNMDLIILSTHGHTGLTRVILGSTAEMVMRHAPCPVLVVREKEHDFLFKKGVGEL
jgi:nucleotide-binding universal stress UspA family protein